MNRKFPTSALLVLAIAAVVLLLPTPTIFGGLGLEGAAFAATGAIRGGTYDFGSATTGNAEINYETESCLHKYGGIISCSDPGDDSDSVEVKANINAAVPSYDIEDDVTNNGLALAFFDDTCAHLKELYEASTTGILGVLENADVISYQEIPGNAVKETSNKNWNIYHFEGQVPRYIPTVGRDFDRLEMQLKISNDLKKQSTLSIQTNTNFCWDYASGELLRIDSPTLNAPVAMVLDIDPVDSDGSPIDAACVDLTPHYQETDVSSLCPRSGLSE